MTLKSKNTFSLTSQEFDRSAFETELNNLIEKYYFKFKEENPDHPIIFNILDSLKNIRDYWSLFLLKNKK